MRQTRNNEGCDTANVSAAGRWLRANNAVNIGAASRQSSASITVDIGVIAKGSTTRDARGITNRRSCANNAGGIIAISRWLSVSDTTGTRPKNAPSRRDGSKPRIHLRKRDMLASLWDAWCFGGVSGGVASLNRRLIAFMPLA